MNQDRRREAYKTMWTQDETMITVRVNGGYAEIDVVRGGETEEGEEINVGLPMSLSDLKHFLSIAAGCIVASESFEANHPQASQAIPAPSAEELALLPEMREKLGTCTPPLVLEPGQEHDWEIVQQHIQGMKLPELKRENRALPPTPREHYERTGEWPVQKDVSALLNGPHTDQAEAARKLDQQTQDLIRMARSSPDFTREDMELILRKLETNTGEKDLEHEGEVMLKMYHLFELMGWEDQAR